MKFIQINVDYFMYYKSFNIINNNNIFNNENDFDNYE